jgi:dTDP-glucose 4,6-dehydratase
MTRVLLTGIGGFIGAHCLDYFLKHTDWTVIGVDSFRHKGSYSRLDEIRFREAEFWKRLELHNYDLSTPISTQLEKKLGPIDIIVNMASDSAVERSITDPVACLRNNYDLAINMLEYARRVKPRIFYQVSTDEVYGDCPPGHSHGEWDAIVPSNPYAASKAAQEAVATAYWRTFGVPVVITNCMNCIGEWQDKEKFLPKLISKIATDQEMEIYGDEGNIGSRFYMDTRSHADVFVWLSKFDPWLYPANSQPLRVNIAATQEFNNLEMAQFVAKIMGKTLKYKLIPMSVCRPGYDRRYALNGDFMKSLGWQEPFDVKESIERIVQWTLKNPHWL